MKNLRELESVLQFEYLNKLLLEGSERYSIEVNYRTNFPEVVEHYSKLVLGYVMAAVKGDYNVKHVYTQKPYRILISTRNWADGEWTGIVSFSEKDKCFVFTPGVYNKFRNTASFDIENSSKCTGTSASEITREVLNQMVDLKKRPLRDGEKLKPIHRKRGPSK